MISARIVLSCSSDGSGDFEVFGVGRVGFDSGATELRALLVGSTLFLFRGAAFFVGDSGAGVAVWSGSNISEGSAFSAPKLFFDRPPARGVAAIGFAVFLLDWGAVRVLRFGAGVNSSSSSSSSTFTSIPSSSSDDSTTTFRREATLLEDRTGDSDMMRSSKCVVFFHSRGKIGYRCG